MVGDASNQQNDSRRRKNGRAVRDGRDALRQLPPVGAVLDHELLARDVSERGRCAVKRAVRRALEEARLGLSNGALVATEPAALASRSLEILERAGSALRPVINATGILLHTGLGRAPLAVDAAAAVEEI